MRKSEEENERKLRGREREHVGLFMEETTKEVKPKEIFFTSFKIGEPGTNDQML